MGVWGAGLYSSDFAMDLRAAIAAVARLPFEGDKLVDLLGEIEPQAAFKPQDEDHTTFWLVIADQFAKRGIDCGRAQERALLIIDQGFDLEMNQKLGMQPSVLSKRKEMLARLRLALTTPKAGSSKPRQILKKPQPRVMNTGDVLVYPTQDGHPINPYYRSKERLKPP